MTNVCPYNDGVTCPPNDRRCATCGWNPEGAKRRAEKKAAKTKDPQRGPTKSKRVAKVDARGKVLEIYSSIAMAAAVNHVSRTTVRNRCEDSVTRFDLDLGYSFKYID
jgi:hypothetical protein